MPKIAYTKKYSTISTVRLPPRQYTASKMFVSNAWVKVFPHKVCLHHNFCLFCLYAVFIDETPEVPTVMTSVGVSYSTGWK